MDVKYLICRFSMNLLLLISQRVQLHIITAYIEDGLLSNIKLQSKSMSIEWVMRDTEVIKMYLQPIGQLFDFDLAINPESIQK